jgi:hypothetical protein
LIVNGIVDLKGFKGKGDTALVRRWIKSAKASLDEVHRAMLELKRETTNIRGHQFYLEVVSVTKDHRKTMRWRMRDGKHVNWPVIQGLLQLMPREMAEWYRMTTLRSRWLIAHEIASRIQWKTALGLMGDIQSTDEA